MNISVRIEIFKEGDVYVALLPKLNVSSFGEDGRRGKNVHKRGYQGFC